MGGIQLVVAGLNLGRNLGQGGLGDDGAPGQKAESDSPRTDTNDCGTSDETHGRTSF
ncbi:hypothetical protein D3C86_2030860 [compost metagenome]